MKLKLSLLLMILIVCSSCSKKNSFEDVQKKIQNMKSYEAKAEIDIYGNKGVSHYNVIQFFKEPNLIRIETITPEFLKGKVITYDGSKYLIFHPIINQKYTIEKLKDDDAIIFMGIIDKSLFLKDEAKYAAKKIEDKNYISIKVNIDDSTPYRKYAEIYFDVEQLLPKIMVIYDENDNNRINVNFTDFKYNKTLDEGIFKGN